MLSYRSGVRSVLAVHGEEYSGAALEQMWDNIQVRAAVSANSPLLCCRSKTLLDSCPYFSILALHWYPQQINGHKFEGKEGDYIRLPERLLNVPDEEIMAGQNMCKLVQFTEYSSQQWFLTENKLPALKNKVIDHLTADMVGRWYFLSRQ